MKKAINKDSIKLCAESVPLMSGLSKMILEKDNESKSEPYLILKFGGIKGGDFTGSPEALSKWEESSTTCISDADYLNNAIEVVKLFNGDIILWWENIKVSKQQAIHYLTNYKAD